MYSLLQKATAKISATIINKSLGQKDIGLRKYNDSFPCIGFRKINFSLRKHTWPGATCTNHCVSKIAPDMDTRRSDERILSINNTTAINIFKAFKKLASWSFNKCYKLKYEITKDTKIDFRYMKIDSVSHLKTRYKRKKKRENKKKLRIK